MREQEFKNWMEKNGKDSGTVRTRSDNVKAIEREIGDLDTLIENGGLAALISRRLYI